MLLIGSPAACNTPGCGIAMVMLLTILLCVSKRLVMFCSCPRFVQLPLIVVLSYNIYGSTIQHVLAKNWDYAYCYRLRPI